jgi:hypothetical protein
MRRIGNQGRTIAEFLADDGCDLPSDHPHVQLYRSVTTVWHGGESPEELEDRIGDGYSCGFAVGYESGLLTAVLKPEWTVGWYHKLREYYLAHNHTLDDLMDWERLAEATARSIPVSAFDSSHEQWKDMGDHADRALPATSETTPKKIERSVP